MIHSIIIANITGYVLLAKYFVKLDVEGMAEWEQTLYNLTSADWQQAMSKTQIASDGKNYIVFFGIDELLIFVTGSEEDDELALADFLKKFIVVLQSLTKKTGKGRLTEAALIDNYGKVGSALDLMVSNGVLHTADLAEIEMLLSMDTTKSDKKEVKKEKK